MGEREEEWHAANGPQAGTRPLGRCSEDKASAPGTPALSTELNGAPQELLFKMMTKIYYD